MTYSEHELEFTFAKNALLIYRDLIIFNLAGVGHFEFSEWIFSFFHHMEASIVEPFFYPHTKLGANISIGSRNIPRKGNYTWRSLKACF